MEIALLHLTDIHIKSGNEPVLKRVKQIKGALHQGAPNASACIVVISGDVAFSGFQTEYDAASAFFEDLRTQIASLPSVRAVEFVVVPGNHDCDFRHESDIREYMLGDIEALYESGISPAGDKAQVLLGVQKAFFSFEAKLTKSKEVAHGDRLSWNRAFKYENYSILFQCFNTAWLSRKEEQQAKLFFPPEALIPPSAGAHLSVSVFHHPYNWLDAINYRLLQDLVEETSDIVFTGHEHQSGGGTIERFSGEQLQYIEGAALSGESGALDSGFGLVVLNFESGEQHLQRFKWNGEYYASNEVRNWSSFITNPARQRKQFRTNNDFFGQLADTGAGFTHKRRELRLADVFVYPDLKSWSVDAFLRGDRKPKVVHSKDLLQYVRDTHLVLFTGSDTCGKSALLRKLYVDLSSEFVPLMLNGAKLSKGISDQKFSKLIEAAVIEQYDESTVERFMQLDPSRVVLLVDDFDRARLTRTSAVKLLEAAQNRFGHIVIAVPDVYELQEMRPDNPFLAFVKCEIKPFGHRLRGQLIYKWLNLGRETAEELESLDSQVSVVEKLITTLLGKNVVPATPFNILSLLQMIESTQPHATHDGSYGALHELLIKAHLSNAGSSGRHNAEIKATYLSMVAFSMFANEKRFFTETELRKLTTEYTRKFDYSPIFPAILSELVSAKSLEQRDGLYAFKYQHYYYYFIAKYFDRTLRRTDSTEAKELRDRLLYMADRLHNEEFANILLFYLYLTQDWELIKHILKNADRIFASTPVADLENDVKFVNTIYKEPAKLLIEDQDVERHRDEYRRQLDEVDDVEDNSAALTLDPKAAYDDAFSDLHKMNIASKMLQVLGQVLRSSASTLEGDQKLRIAEACYSLGLRTLRTLLRIAEGNVETLRVYISALIKERAAVIAKDQPLTEGQIARRTDQGVIWLTHMWAYGMIRKISYSVGHEQLGETYEKVLALNPGNAAVRMVDLAVKLEHMATVPEYEIFSLRDKVVGNLFTYQVLRQLIADFLYLHRVEFRTLQRLGGLFKIEGVTSAEFLLAEKVGE